MSAAPDWPMLSERLSRRTRRGSANLTRHIIVGWESSHQGLNFFWSSHDVGMVEAWCPYF